MDKEMITWYQPQQDPVGETFGDRTPAGSIKKERQIAMVNLSPYVMRTAMLMEELPESQIRAVYMVVEEFHSMLKLPHDKK